MSPRILAESLETPIEERHEVIVAGGGASGLIAALASARMGRKVLLIEREGCLGGTATSGYVAQYIGFFNAERRAVAGLPDELTRRIEAAGGSDGFGDYMMAEAAANPLTLRRFPFNPEIVKMVADEMADEAGIETLFHARVVGVLKDAGIVGGVIVETIEGRRAHAATPLFLSRWECGGKVAAPAARRRHCWCRGGIAAAISLPWRQPGGIVVALAARRRHSIGSSGSRRHGCIGWRQ